jgi:hypothetical protein
MFTNRENAELHLELFDLPQNFSGDAISYITNTTKSIYSNAGMRFMENGLPLVSIEKATLKFYNNVQNYAKIKAGKVDPKLNFEGISNPILLNPLLLKNSAYLATNITLAIDLWEGENKSGEELKLLKTKQTELMLPVVDALVALRLILEEKLNPDNFVIPDYIDVVRTLAVPCSEDFDNIVVV